MRFLLIATLALLACSADPVLLPDAGPCSSACGVGTVCMDGACVAVDGGGADVVAVADAGVDAPTVVDRPAAMDTPVAVVDAGTDGGTDAGAGGTCRDAGVDLRAGTLLSTGVFTNCGACGVTCTRQQRCTNGACVVRCPNGLTAQCDGRNVTLSTGERDGGMGQTFFCGACSGPGSVCADGEGCDSCLCAR